MKKSSTKLSKQGCYSIKGASCKLHMIDCDLGVAWVRLMIRVCGSEWGQMTNVVIGNWGIST